MSLETTTRDCLDAAWECLFHTFLGLEGNMGVFKATSGGCLKAAWGCLFHARRLFHAGRLFHASQAAGRCMCVLKVRLEAVLRPLGKVVYFIHAWLGQDKSGRCSLRPCMG